MIINIPIPRLPLVVPIPNSFEYNIAKIPVKAYRVSSATSGIAYYNGDQSSIGYIPFALVSQIDGTNVEGLTWVYSLSFGGGGLQFNIGATYQVLVSNASVSVSKYNNTSFSESFRIIVFAIPADATTI